MAKKHTVLVTGASTGIGRATAEYLAERGARVLAGARSPAALDSLERIDGVTAIQLDVCDQRSVEAARRRAEGIAGHLDGLVNNAGTAVAGPWMDVSPEMLQAQLEVNLIGVHRVTRAFFPMLLAARGTIVNISSTGGRVAMPFMGPHVASKFALEALSDSLRRELATCGVAVCVVQPGAIRTPIWTKTDPDRAVASPLFGDRARAFGRMWIERAARNGMPPARVARVVARALAAASPRPRYLVTEANLTTRLAGWLPDRWLDAIVARAVRGAVAAT